MDNDNNQPTATLHPCGVFSCVVDGVEWRSGTGEFWFRDTGEDPWDTDGGAELFNTLRAAAYRAMGEALTQASVQRGIDQARRGELADGPEIPTADTILDRGSEWASLTAEERTAVEGAIRDAERGLETYVIPVRLNWWKKYVQSLCEDVGYAPTDYMSSRAHTVWDTRTGQRTVLDVDAFREAVGVESEEWREWCGEQVAAKNREDGVRASMNRNETPEWWFSHFPQYTHILDATTGHWHTRPEPEEEEPEYTYLESRLVESLEELDQLLKSGNVVECRTYRRISPNPPRVRVEESQ